MFALILVLKTPGLVWRHRWSGATLVLVAPLVLTGALSLFAINGLAIELAGFMILKALEGNKQRRRPRLSRMRRR